MLPELVPGRELGAANASNEMGTFLAILLGTLKGGALVALRGAGPWVVSASLTSIAGLGWFMARRIPNGTPADATLRIERGLVAPRGGS